MADGGSYHNLRIGDMDLELRRDPQRLLEQIEEEEKRQRRGRLKIFLGYASGVGKSAKMFAEGVRRRERGEDVVVGAVQPQSSPEIERLISRHEVIPTLKIGGRDVIDIERILRRHAEDIVSRLNRFERADEKPFEAVAEVSEFNQRAYELFLQPLIQSTSNEFTAKLGRQFHPLRFQRWSMSDLNPWLAWLGPAAEVVKTNRQSVDGDNAALKVEKAMSATISASLEYYRAVRDAASEATFFQTYGNVFSLYIADKREAKEKATAQIAEPRELPFVKEALASIAEGGYPEALARVACLLARKGEPMLLSRLQMKQELMTEYRELLPAMPPDQWRRIRGEQEIIVRYEPEQALATLPKLLADPVDREKLVTLVRRLLADERVQRAKPSTEQLAMVEHIGEALHLSPLPAKRAAAGKKRSGGRKARARG